MEPLIFTLAILNSALLTAIFISHILGRTALVRRIGIAYIALAVPGAAALCLAAVSGAVVPVIFLCIFLVYIALEWLYDYALKLPFRSNWKLLVPYLALYFSMNYGFFVMSYRQSAVQGFIVLALTVIQITANILTHRKKRNAE